jgi:hypothetical protein
LDRDDDLEQLRSENSDLLLSLADEKSKRQRAEANALSLAKKVERLSMKIISLWGSPSAE